MYDLYGMPKTRATRVVWTLEELGVEYRYHLIDLLKGEGQKPDFLAINPSGKVPALVDDELVLTESAAICTYLCDRHPERGLVPQVGTAERGKYDQWCYFIMAELEQPLWTVGKHKFVFPEEKRVPAILEVAAWEFKRAAALLEAGLQGRQYLVGNSFSPADILAAHTLIWARAFQVPHDIESLNEYQQRICDRPAFVRVREREAAVMESA